MRGKAEEINSRKVILNYIKRKGTCLPAVFANTATCQACGKLTYVNTFGFCEKCWITHAHVRKAKG